MPSPTAVTTVKNKSKDCPKAFKFDFPPDAVTVARLAANAQSFNLPAFDACRCLQLRYVSRIAHP